MKNNELMGTPDNLVPTQDEIDQVVTELKKDGKAIPGMFKYGLIMEDDSSIKPYLLLLKLVNDDFKDEEEIRDWQVSIGRQETYEHLRRLIQADAIIPEESYVLSGNTPFEEAITVFRFMKVMADSNLIVEETGFDINEYDPGKEDKKIVEEA